MGLPIGYTPRGALTSHGPWSQAYRCMHADVADEELGTANEVDSLITASSAEIACGGFHLHVPLAAQPSERKRESFSPKSNARITVPGTSARPAPWLVGSQEQTQIITSAIGRPTPNAPPTINANAESKLSSAWTARLDMPLLHRAPTSTARRPKDERKKARVWSLPEPERFKAESLWLRKS
jgi:hypothetical protein